MRWVISITCGGAVGFVWMAIGVGVLRLLNLAGIWQTAPDQASKRDRLRRLGKLRYMVLFRPSVDRYVQKKGWPLR